MLSLKKTISIQSKKQEVIFLMTVYVAVASNGAKPLLFLLSNVKHVDVLKRTFFYFTTKNVQLLSGKIMAEQNCIKFWFGEILYRATSALYF